MNTITAAELAARVCHHGLQCDTTTAALFLSEWLNNGITEERLPGRYRITDYGHQFATGLIPLNLEEAA